MAENTLWPAVDKLESAKSAARQGFWAAVFVAGVTALVAGIAVATGNPVLGIDAWAFVDVAIFAALAFGIYRMSRFAASVALVLFLAERLYMMSVTGTARGWILTAFLALAFVNSIRGTFAHHRISNLPVPGQPPPPIAP